MSGSVNEDMSGMSDFKLLDRKVMITLLNMPERNTFFRALSLWVGYKTTSIYYDVQDREIGQSKWSTWKLIKYAVNNITSFTSSPMQIVTAIGGIMLIIDIVFGVIALVQKIMGTAIGGFTTVILLLLLIGSLILISLGVIGFYISKIYEEIKGRPRYLIRDMVEHRE
jgi:dolichol-phosphate mannosyltransferase